MDYLEPIITKIKEEIEK